MYEYKFIRVDLSTWAIPTTKPKEDYHKIILEHAREGWRLVQIFAPSVSSGGFAAYFELIFEK